MVITELIKKRGRLFQLVLDGEPSVTVDVRTFEESPYKVGSSLSDEQLERLVEESRRRRSREKALYLLSLRDYSRSELEKKLRRDFDENTARETAGRIEELGLINDTSFARNRAKDLMKRKLYPSRRIFQELLALGVDRETAQEAVDGLDCDDVKQALALLSKKYYNKKTNNGHGEEDYRRTAGALARYGFDGETIRRAMNDLKSQEQDMELYD
jgi:regulatory protein